MKFLSFHIHVIPSEIKPTNQPDSNEWIRPEPVVLLEPDYNTLCGEWSQN